MEPDVFKMGVKADDFDKAEDVRDVSAGDEDGESEAGPAEGNQISLPLT
jgi:hypothetical protein